MSNESQNCPLRERAVYGFGDFASCLFWQTITLYLLFFYTDVFGLSAAAAIVLAACSVFEKPVPPPPPAAVP